MASTSCAVVIPVFGRHELTHALIADIVREGRDETTIVIDNGGDYVPAARERVLPQRENLGWLRGSNAGIRAALPTEPDAIVLLNNDTRLSLGFFDGLMEAAARRRVGIVAPRYDDHLPQQRFVQDGPAAEYRPRARERRVHFVDGTCMLIRRAVLDQVGLLDEEAFGPTGWGADIDLAIRARRAGWRVVVTDRAYLTHATASTAAVAHGDNDTYWARGDADMRSGLSAKWGADWPWISGVAGRGRRERMRRLISRGTAPVGVGRLRDRR